MSVGFGLGGHLFLYCARWQLCLVSRALYVQDNVCSKVFGARWPHYGYVSLLFLVLSCALATSFLAGSLQHWMVISGSHILLSEYIIQLFASGGRMPGVNVILQHTSVLLCVRFFRFVGPLMWSPTV